MEEKVKKRYRTINQCTEVETLRVESVVAKVIDEIGHDSVSKLYHLSNTLRNEFGINKFPIYFIYILSLFEKLEDPEQYGKLSTKNFAEREELSIRTANNIRKKFYENKEKKFAIQKVL